MDARRFHIIPHGIDIPPPPANPKGGADEREAKVLYVGRFESSKGADVLLEAVPRVLNDWGQKERATEPGIVEHVQQLLEASSLWG